MIQKINFKKTIIFDLHGTLVDYKKRYIKSYQEVLKNWQIFIDDEIINIRKKGYNQNQILSILIPERKDKNKIINECIKKRYKIIERKGCFTRHCDRYRSGGGTHWYRDL